MSILTNFNPDFLPVSLTQDTFIETGTAHGDSLANAMKEKFRRFISIEVCERSWLEATARFGCAKFYNNATNMWGRPTGDGIFEKVTLDLYLGSSPDILQQVLQPDETTTLYLDAHFCGTDDRTEMDQKYGECPLMAELDAIMAVPWKKLPIIVIDDCHMFCSQEWWRRYGSAFHYTDWPTFDRIYDRLGGTDNKYNFFQKDGILYCWPNL